MEEDEEEEETKWIEDTQRSRGEQLFTDDRSK